MPAALAANERAPAATRPTARAAVLQFGLYQKDGDAWWAWKTLQRKAPDLVKGLVPAVRAGSAGAFLRATVPADVDAVALCRRIVGAGFGCLVIDAPRPAAPAATPAVAAAPMPTQTIGATPAVLAAPPVTATPIVLWTPPVPARKPIMAGADAAPQAVDGVPAQTQSVIPAATQSVVAALAIAAPPPARPTAAMAVALPGALPGSMAVPLPAAMAMPLPVAMAVPTLPVAMAVPLPPQAGVPAVAAPPGAPAPNETITYSEDDARVMAEIDRRNRRQGRLGAVLPGSTIEITPAVLRQGMNLCALTFDDGPHRTVTRQVLDILNAEKVVATYFPIGKVAQQHSDVIRDWVAAGHEIGNHSNTHSDLRALPLAAQRAEIADANRTLRSLGANPVLFRPPYGRYNADLLGSARAENMTAVLWNVDTRDWKVRDAEKVVQHVRTTAGTGSVLLMHSTYPSTAAALPRVIAELRAKGCEFVTLSQWIDRMHRLAELQLVNASAGRPNPN